MRYRYQHSHLLTHLLDSEDSSGNRFGSMLKTAFVFSVVLVAAAVLVAPLLHDVGQRYAHSGGYGIDRTYTGSVSKPERYRLRQSVLVPGVEKICETQNARACRD